jgi:hypothetical protein
MLVTLTGFSKNILKKAEDRNILTFLLNNPSDSYLKEVNMVISLVGYNYINCKAYLDNGKVAKISTNDFVGFYDESRQKHIWVSDIFNTQKSTFKNEGFTKVKLNKCYWDKVGKKPKIKFLSCNYKFQSDFKNNVKCSLNEYQLIQVTSNRKIFEKDIFFGKSIDKLVEGINHDTERKIYVA